MATGPALFRIGVASAPGGLVMHSFTLYLLRQNSNFGEMRKYQLS